MEEEEGGEEKVCGALPGGVQGRKRGKKNDLERSGLFNRLRAEKRLTPAVAQSYQSRPSKAQVQSEVRNIGTRKTGKRRHTKTERGKKGVSASSPELCALIVLRAFIKSQSRRRQRTDCQRISPGKNRTRRGERPTKSNPKLRNLINIGNELKRGGKNQSVNSEGTAAAAAEMTLLPGSESDARKRRSDRMSDKKSNSRNEASPVKTGRRSWWACSYGGWTNITVRS